jgi:hypothetical protein
MHTHAGKQVIPLAADRPIRDRVFSVAPLAMPFGWESYYVFV